MKKIMAILISLVFVVAMAACSNKSTTTPDDANAKQSGGILYGKIDSINGSEFNLMVLEDIGVDALCPLATEDPNATATVDDNSGGGTSDGTIPMPVSVPSDTQQITGSTIPMPVSVPSDTQQTMGSSVPNIAGDGTSEDSTVGGNVAMPLPYDADSVTQLYLAENGEYQQMTIKRNVEIVDPSGNKLEFKDLKVGVSIMVTFDEATGEIKQIMIIG